MKAEEIQEEIRLIKAMVEKTRRSTTGSGAYLVVWGLLIILAVAVMYALIYLEKYNLIWVDWFVLMGLGAAFTSLKARKAEKRATFKTYAEETLKHLWIGSGIAFFLTGFIFPLAGVYSYEVISILVSTIAGLAVFVSGGIYEWNFLKWCGVVWWAAAVVMIFVHPNYRALVFIPATFFGYLLPGIIINRMYKKGGEQ
ncbi:MAG: hypothetical protein GXO74_11740 [Calditrichaeota bacterium]|nr:hypothetical protein [Calditrichota bacterium]